MRSTRRSRAKPIKGDALEFLDPIILGVVVGENVIGMESACPLLLSLVLFGHDRMCAQIVAKGEVTEGFGVRRLVAMDVEQRTAAFCCE